MTISLNVTNNVVVAAILDAVNVVIMPRGGVNDSETDSLEVVYFIGSIEGSGTVGVKVFLLFDV